jgi:hypothetical protein
MTSSPGELAIWGPLTVFMAAVALVILTNIRTEGNGLACEFLSQP